MIFWGVFRPGNGSSSTPFPASFTTDKATVVSPYELSVPVAIVNTSRVSRAPVCTIVLDIPAISKYATSFTAPLIKPQTSVTLNVSLSADVSIIASLHTVAYGRDSTVTCR